MKNESGDKQEKLPPAIQAVLDKNEVEQTEIALKWMCRWRKEGKWGNVELRREKDTIIVSWLFHSEKTFELSDCTIYIRNVPLEPNEHNCPRSALGMLGSIRGSASYILDEGSCYIFDFWFRAKKVINLKPEEFGNCLSFVVSIPLSPENRSLLKDVIFRQNNVEAHILHTAESLLSKQAAFQEGIARAIAKIKSKQLPQKEEEVLIDDFLERIDLEKEKFGL